MTLPDIWLSITVLINFVLATLIYFKTAKTRANILYALAVLSSAFWTFCMIMFRNTEGGSLNIWSIILWSFTIPIVYFFLYFTFNFPEKQRVSLSLHIIINTIAIIIIPVFIVYLGILESVTVINGYKGFIFKLPYFYFYCLYIIGYFTTAFLILFKKYFKATGLVKMQLTFVIAGTFISSLAGVIFGLVFPFLGNFKLYWLSPGASIVMTGFIAYAILKHHLMNIKVITTEIFSILISLILLINALLSKSLNDFILNFSLFLAISFFSVLLIRSVLKEVKSREELAELTEKLQAANEDLKKLDKAKSEFISIASHQLRTPLSIIKGFASMLEEGSYGQMNEKAKDILGKIGSSSDRLTRLINDLLDLSRMEGGQMKFEWEFIKMDELIQSVVEELAPQAEKKGVNFKWLNQAPEKMYVRADREKLRQVVMNLIDNAIKYTPKGFVEVKLVKTPENQARFSVKDSGVGMDQEEMQMIFGKFVRGKKTPRLWTEGVGLGLYVARKILEEHKGTIWAESEGEGKGSTFFVEIPVY